MSRKTFWIITAFLCLYLCIFSVQKINLLTADIGRHIENGNIFLHSGEFGISKTALLYTNLFSYTHPDFPFINHHWGSGIAAYLIFSIAGFKGLSLVYILLILLACIFALLTIRKNCDLWSMLLVGLFLMPLVAGRMEVRPEAVSYLFIAFFTYLLYQYSKSRISFRWIVLVPILEIIWSNLHIYFIFGPFLVGVFLFEELVRRNWDRVKKLSGILLLTSLATLLTPYGISGVVYPFTIFQNYGYRIVENQSISFLEHLSLANPSFLWYKITLGLVLVSSIIVLWKKRRDFAISLTIVSLTFAVLAYFGIRHMSVFALVSLPLLVYNISLGRQALSKKVPREAVTFCGSLLVFCIVFTTFFHFSQRLAWNRDFGLGLTDESLGSIAFIKQTGIRGPFFNNYDIGGAMIFSFFPAEKVFVDNRPEAYPASFFTDTYIPMQENDAVWRKIGAEENFNAIYFYRLDLTPWAQKFLITRVNDPVWAPVYVDAETIIFLKRNPENKKLIEKYELPRSMFGN